MVLFIALKHMLCSIKTFMTEEIELKLRNVLDVLTCCLVVILV